MKTALMSLSLLAALVSINAVADCDPAAFKKATGCESNKSVWSATFENKVFNGFYNYCKQYPETRFAVLTAKAEGQAVVVDKNSCQKQTYKVDSSGVAEMKVVGGFSWIRAVDGELYLIDANGNLFEVLSQRRGDRGGNPYSKGTGSGVLDIKGDGTNQKLLHIKAQSGPFDLTADDVISRHQYRSVELLNLGW